MAWCLGTHSSPNCSYFLFCVRLIYLSLLSSLWCLSGVAGHFKVCLCSAAWLGFSVFAVVGYRHGFVHGILQVKYPSGMVVFRMWLSK
jgi:hypothetical protein